MKKRVISAIVMILILTPILIVGDIYYVLFCSILGMMALWEILRLEKNIPNSMKIFCYIWCLFIILHEYKSIEYQNALNLPIILLMFLIFSISVIINGDLKKYNYKDSVWLLIITILIGVLFNSIIRIRFIGLQYTVYCLIVAVSTDTFAYIGGRLFGKKKISPNISPNKTFAGSVIGSIIGTIVASIYYYFMISGMKVEMLLLLSFVLSILCQCGDLFFSSIKRYYGVKDFSNLIPGHGGILDRLDSTLFVVIGFLLYNMFI